MKTLVSGQAGLAIFIQGNEIEVISVDDKETEKKLPLNALNGLLADATDIITYDSISKSNAIKSLELYWRFDRSLHLTIILLDINELEKISLLAAECLEELFQDRDVLNYIFNVMYSAPLPPSASIDKAMKVSQGKTILISFLEELRTDQNIIEKYVNAWNALPVECFDSIDLKNSFQYELINKGAFRCFVKAHDDYRKFTTAQINFLIVLKALPRYRQVLSLWLRDLKPKQKEELEILEEEQVIGEEEENRGPKRREDRPKVHDIITNIEQQKKGIIKNIERGNLKLARRYVEDLVNVQREVSEPEYIAKSLCDLAQDAKRVYNYSFQLELSQRAVSIAPYDGWAHGQLADAYFCLHKFSEALQSFDVAISCGQEAFGLKGFARILVEQGRFEEALDAYGGLKNKFPEDYTIWAGFAEVLRKMWRLDLALGAYDEAINKFPSEAVLKCGRAATLTDMGRLEEARSAYDECIKTLGEDEVSLNGKGTVLREMGNFSEALKLYSRSSKQFPESVALLYGNAKVLCDMGEYQQALTRLNIICSAYPYEVRAWFRKAEVLKELRQFNEAITVYDLAIEKFPFNIWIRNGRASVYKKQGAYEKALQAYEDNLSHAPYDIVAKCGKADLLKELGKFEEALATYDDIIRDNPHWKSLQHAKASIFIALGNYSKAEELLSYLKKPSTRDDWIAYHIKGVLLLKTNKIDEAISLFDTALKTNPFLTERKYFRNSLGVAKLKRKDFGGAIKLLSGETMPMVNILCLHAWGEIAKNNKYKIKKAKIARECLKADCPPYLVPLMVELELRYFNDVPDGKHSEEWIFEQECIGGALSSV